MTQDEEALVQYRSHQAHRREREAEGKKGENHRGVYEEEQGERTSRGNILSIKDSIKSSDLKPLETRGLENVLTK